MKKCFKCGAEKPLSDFYKHKQMGDGHLNKCKECSKKDVSANYRKNIDYYKEYERSRTSLPNRVAARIAYAQSDAGKIRQNIAKIKWTRRNPIKRMANIIVGNAVRDGKLIKSCSCGSCGSTPSRIHGHHDDYAYPLVVRWLCPGCHNKWHKENGEGANAF